MSVENNTNSRGDTIKAWGNRENELSRVTIKDCGLVHTPLVINKQILTC